MAAENTVVADVINQRLDALDRVLLGLLPRNERLAIVADVEAKVRMAYETNPVSPELAAMPVDALPLSEAAAGQRLRIARRRSALALTSGVIGIVALALLFALPITYLVVATNLEGIGEITSYILLSGNIVTVALGGAAAVIMGFVALVRLHRQQEAQRGHGWAILALCAGSLPMFVGVLGTITIVLPMMTELASEHAQASSPSYVMLPKQSESRAVCSTSESCSPTDQAQLPVVVAGPAPNVATPVANYPVQPGVCHPIQCMETPALTSATSPTSLPAPSPPAPLQPAPALIDDCRIGGSEDGVDRTNGGYTLSASEQE